MKNQQPRLHGKVLQKEVELLAQTGITALRTNFSSNENILKCTFFLNRTKNKTCYNLYRRVGDYILKGILLFSPVITLMLTLCSQFETKPKNTKHGD